MIGLVALALGALAYARGEQRGLLFVLLGSALSDAFNLNLGKAAFSTAGLLGLLIVLRERGVNASYFRKSAGVLIVLTLPVAIGAYFVALAPFDDAYAAYRQSTQLLQFKYLVQVLRVLELVLACYALYRTVSRLRDPVGSILNALLALGILVAAATVTDAMTDNALKHLLFERTVDDRVTGLSVEPRQLAREMGVVILFVVTVCRDRLREAKAVTLLGLAAALLIGTYSVSGVATSLVVLFGYLFYAYPRRIETYAVAVGFVSICFTGLWLSPDVRTQIRLRTVDKLRISLLNYVPEAPKWVAGLEVFDAAAVAYLYNHPQHLALGTGPNLINIPAAEYVSRYQRQFYPYGIVSTPHMGIIQLLANAGIFGLVAFALAWYRFSGHVKIYPGATAWLVTTIAFYMVVAVNWLFLSAAMVLAIAQHPSSRRASPLTPA